MLAIGYDRRADDMSGKRLLITSFLCWLTLISGSGLTLIFWGQSPYIYMTTTTSVGAALLLWLTSRGHLVASWLILSLNLNILLATQAVQGEVPFYLNFIATGVGAFVLIDFKKLFALTSTYLSSVVLGGFSYAYPTMLAFPPHSLGPEAVDILKYFNMLICFVAASWPPLVLVIMVNRYHIGLLEAQETEMGNSKMAALGEMAAGVAHEINNPLGVIQGWADQMNTMVDEKDVDEEVIEEASRSIDRNSQLIAKIVKSLQIFTRDSKGDAFLSTNLREVCEASLELVADKLKHTEITLEFHLTDQVVLCSPSEVLQVLVILVNNAADALLSSDVEDKIIKIHLTQTPEGESLLYVEDNGPGIPPEIIKKIFEPFFTTKDVGRGTGLGLSIGTNIMNKHGGAFYVESKVGETKFFLKFPSYKPMAAGIAS